MRFSTILLLLAVLPHFGFGDKKKDDCDNCENPNTPRISEEREKDALEFGLQVVERAQNIPCEELPVGKSRVIEVHGYQSPSTIEHMYKLSRKSENEYEAVLNLRFLPTVGGAETSATFDESLDQKMKAKVEQCLKIANKALLGPGGKKLSLRLSGNEEEPQAPQVDIRVAPADARADSRSYPEDITCATITHELMHLMGLVDEYEEHAMGYVIDSTGLAKWVNENPTFTAYDCRAIGSNESLMNLHYSAFYDVFGSGNPPERALCTCNNSLCVNRLKSGSLADSLPPDELCPHGSTMTFHEGPWPDSSSDGLIPKDKAQFFVVRGTTPREGKSLLMPAHFSAIVNPGCRENFGYYQCSVDAYRTSKDHKGEGCALDPRPKHCVDGDGSHWFKRGSHAE